MTVKLNLTIDKSVAREIKSYAARNKTSVSRIVEKQLQEMLLINQKDDSFHKFLKKYTGSLKGDINYEKTKDEYLKEKYGY